MPTRDHIITFVFIYFTFRSNTTVLNIHTFSVQYQKITILYMELDGMEQNIIMNYFLLENMEYIIMCTGILSHGRYNKLSVIKIKQ